MSLSSRQLCHLINQKKEQNEPKSLVYKTVVGFTPNFMRDTHRVSKHASIVKQRTNTLITTGYTGYTGYTGPTGPSGVEAGDLKYSFKTADHGGWVLLNGRATSTLPAAQQAEATTLGLTPNIPNAQDKILQQTGAVATTVGTNTRTLTQANLPNVTQTVTISSAGDHTHTYSNQTAFIANTGSASFTITGGATTQNTSTAGAHIHPATVTSINPGAQTALDIQPQRLTANAFVYLGHP